MSSRAAKPLSLLMLITLVTGNMVGSGIFLLPTSLAQIGSISLYSWCFTAVGAMLLAYIFAKLSRVMPETGGPYAYASAGLGAYIGFQTAYNYWLALWIGNAAIAIALVGYLQIFFPILARSEYTSLTAIAMIWLLTFVNIIGVRSAGWLQLVSTVLKLIPLLLVGLVGWFYFHPSYLSSAYNISGTSNLHAFSHAATLTLWAFIGLEAATVPAGSVHNPKRNIPLATLIGTLLAAVVYILSSTAIMGLIPNAQLSHSVSPFADAAGVLFGHWGRWLIACGSVISCIGALNGWIMLQGQIAMAAADKGQFPKVFARRNSRGSPAMSLIITAVLITILLALITNKSLVTQFNIIILIAVLASLLPYFYTSISQFVIAKSYPTEFDRRHTVIAILGVCYTAWTIFSAGPEIIYYGMILILSSVPVYAWVRCTREL